MAETTEMWASQTGSDTPRAGDEARANFTNRNANKSRKAIIGITILMALSVVLYEVNGPHHGANSSASPPQSSHFAWSAH